MSRPLPTHEVVAVFPAEIKAGIVRLPVRMHGEMQVLTASESVMTGLVASLVERGIKAPQIASGEPLPELRGRGRPVAQREYWRRMRALRFEYDNLPRAEANLRVLAERHDLPYGSTFNAFKKIRDGHAPFPDEEPRAPLSKPNGKLL